MEGRQGASPSTFVKASVFAKATPDKTADKCRRRLNKKKTTQERRGLKTVKD
jgi:hypothetical protein